jgi:hypothetical protein
LGAEILSGEVGEYVSGSVRFQPIFDVVYSGMNDVV